MHTDQLISMLAAGAGPVPRAAVARRVAPALALGGGLALALVLLGLGPLPAAQARADVALWMKLGYAGALAAAAVALTARLARPVARTGGPAGAAAAVLLGMAALGAAAWWATPAEGRALQLLGRSWVSCPWIVLGVSLPTLATLLWALRGLAPTRPVQAGAAAGLAAGAVGALAYALHCPERSATFVAVWYTLGIALAAGLGALLGPRVLRW